VIGTTDAEAKRIMINLPSALFERSAFGVYGSPNIRVDQYATQRIPRSEDYLHQMKLQIYASA